MPIIINPKAVIDNNQRKVIAGIEPHTEGHTLYVTRGHSLPIDQLNTIEEYAKRHDCLFSEFIIGDLHTKVDIWLQGQKINVYAWQQTWATLLHLYWISNGIRGAIINPPLATICLFNYFNNGRNKKGEVIQPSPHIKALDDPKPCPIDFSQRIDGKVVNGVMIGGTPDIKTVSAIMERARAANIGVRSITVEAANGCVHIDTIII